MQEPSFEKCLVQSTRRCEGLQKCRFGDSQVLAKILRFRTGIQKAIQFRKAENTSFVNLMKYTINSPRHIFGVHDKRSSYFCSKTTAEDNIFHKLEETQLFNRIMMFLEQLTRHCKILLRDVDSDVEIVNSITRSQ